jgi:hypothetical protein
MEAIMETGLKRAADGGWGRGFLPLCLMLLAGTAGAASINAVETYGNFETAGVTLALAGQNYNETATLEYRREGETIWRAAHDFRQFDGNHMATSLFGLRSATLYELRITLFDPDGVTGTNPWLAAVTTSPEYTLPAPLRIVPVSNQTGLEDALADAQAGDEIRLAPGTYPDGVHLYGFSAEVEHPLVIAAQGPGRPLIQGSADGGIELDGCSHVVFDFLEVHNEAGDGINLRGCHHVVIRRCYIHDSQPGDYTNNIFIQHGEESDPPYTGHFLILDNVIGDDVHDAVDESQGPGASNENAPGQSYFGIHLEYTPGAYVTIRGNVIYGVVDGIHPDGDEGGEPVLGPFDPDVLSTWPDRELDLYDNLVYDCKDDAIECDGHMVNGRIFRNRLGKCENAVSVAPFYAGPLFVLRNVIHGFHQGCLKQNTGVAGITRNVLFYHNTVLEKTPPLPGQGEPEYCLYRGEPGQQQDFVYLNNVFSARGRVYDGDVYSGGTYHTNDCFDHDLMYSTREFDNPYVYKWVTYDGDSLNNTRYADLPSFQAAVGQEPNGRWGEPLLAAELLAGFPSSSKLLELSLGAGSAAVDGGTPIPGINDGFVGAAPDCGAFESGTPGDVNGSGAADALDLTAVALVLAGWVRAGQMPCFWPLGTDFDASGQLNGADWTALANYLAGN